MDLGAEETSSLCEQLITMGFPLVIGMRDLVKPEFAHAFAREFYHRTFAALAKVHAAGKGTLDLGESFSLACQGIVAAVPGGGPAHVMAASRREWTLPVMAVRDGKVDIEVLRRPGPGAPVHIPGPQPGAPGTEAREELLGELEGLRGFAAASGDTLTVEQRDGIQRRIAEIEAKLLDFLGPSV